jgi:uncharacterized membrane protein
MSLITRHVTRCFFAGIVALLPVGGFVLTVVWLESSIAGAWLARQPWYFPGLGMIVAAVGIYAIGLTVSTFVGRWAWKKIDRLFDSVPALGRLYQTLKQIVGYGEGRDAIFQQVVLVPIGENEGHELGLVTTELTNDAGVLQYVIFVPDAPNPTTGRLVIIDRSAVRAVGIPVSDAFKSLISLGKTPIFVSQAASVV